MALLGRRSSLLFLASPVVLLGQLQQMLATSPTYNNLVPSDRPGILPALTQRFANEVAKIATAIPHEQLAIQWDVCQEVLAWEGYYDKGPVDFRTETLDVLAKVANLGF
jgi:hypothetical protein